MKKLVKVSLLASLLMLLLYTTAVAQEGEGDEPDVPEPPYVLSALPALPRAAYLVGKGNGQYFVATRVLSPDFNEQIIYDEASPNAVPTWSRSGRLLLFAGKVNGADEVLVFNSIWNTVTNLTHNPATDTDPAWSLNYRQIAFASDRGREAGATEIYVMDVNGVGVERLTRSGPQGRAWQPFWSPDGRSIYYFFKANKDAPGTIRVVQPDSPQFDREFMALPRNLRSPLIWSPDGKLLSFMRQNGESIDLLVGKINDDGSGPQDHQLKTLTYFASVEQIANERNDPHLKLWKHRFIWTADSKAIYYEGFDGTNYQIFRLELATGQITNISHAAGHNRMPTLSPDGRTLLYVQNTTHQYELIMANADGSNPIRLTITGGDEMSPQWAGPILQEF